MMRTIKLIWLPKKFWSFKVPQEGIRSIVWLVSPIDKRDRGYVDLLVSRDTNDDFMVLVKGFEQDPDLVTKKFHPSIDDDSKAIEIEKEENNDKNAPKTPYDGENMNASSY